MTAPKKDLFKLGTLGVRKNGKVTGVTNLINGQKVQDSKPSCRIQMTVCFGLHSTTTSNSSTSPLFVTTMMVRIKISWQISTNFASLA